MIYNVLDVCRHTINYSNENNYEISNLKLQKLLYFIQAYYLVELSQRCFNERIEAWDFGPVVPEAYREFKQYGGANIPSIKYVYLVNDKNPWNSRKVLYKDDIILGEDKKRINHIVAHFSRYSATELVDITHHQTPWFNAYVPFENNEITDDEIRAYFNG